MHPHVISPQHVPQTQSQQSSVASTIRALSAGASPPEVWRQTAFALLRVNVAECEAVGRVFEDDSTTDEARLLCLDLLAGAATVEAQAIMRKLITLPAARRSEKTFVAFVHRLGIVEHPDVPTLRLLACFYAESRGKPPDLRAACAYALGAAAGHAFASGEPAAAVRVGCAAP